MTSRRDYLKLSATADLTLAISPKLMLAAEGNVAGVRDVLQALVDLVQVHNLADVPTQLGLLNEYPDAGRVRYIGVTTTAERQYAELEQVMRAEPLNFIGVD
ncbi:MAG: hypothetical protein QM674_20470 [Burkholderiaceae bacterium]